MMMTLNAIELLTFEWFIYVTSVLSQLKKYIQTEKKTVYLKFACLCMQMALVLSPRKNPFETAGGG